MSLIRKGRMWRVQITQPDGSARYFGRFSSERRAREWIAAHARLIDWGSENCNAWIQLRGYAPWRDLSLVASCEKLAAMSALLLKADINGVHRDVRFVPKADIEVHGGVMSGEL